MIACRDFRYFYPDAIEPALEVPELKIGAGELVLLCGPTGCGKTTLLRAVAGILHSFRGGRIAGSVLTGGLDARRVPLNRIAGKAVMVSQDPEDQLLGRTVMGAVSFGPANLGRHPEETARAVKWTLDEMGIAHLAGRRLETLSGGEKQKVVIASALVMGPSALLLDEPTSQLDPAAAGDLMAVLRRLCSRSGMTVLCSEHRLERVLPVADRLLYMEDGRIVHDGPAESAGTALPVRFMPGPAEEPGDGGPVSRQRQEGPAVSLRSLRYSYGDGEVLKGVDLELAHGGVLAIVGENGAGKSTLLKLIAGVLKPMGGEAFVAGRPAGLEAAAEGRCSMLGQDPADYLIEDSPLAEVRRTLAYRGWPATDADREAGAVLASVGMAGMEGADRRGLSGGAVQRLAVASVMAGGVEVLLLDEPTRGIDGPGKASLAGLLHDMAARGKTVVIASHDHPFIAAAADVTAVLRDGVLVAEEDAGGFTERPAAVLREPAC